jgi:hypothetical protein
MILPLLTVLELTGCASSEPMDTGNLDLPAQDIGYDYFSYSEEIGKLLDNYESDGKISVGDVQEQFISMSDEYATAMAVDWNDDGAMNASLFKQGSQNHKNYVGSFKEEYFLDLGPKPAELRIQRILNSNDTDLKQLLAALSRFPASLSEPLIHELLYVRLSSYDQGDLKLLQASLETYYTKADPNFIAYVEQILHSGLMADHGDDQARINAAYLMSTGELLPYPVFPLIQTANNSEMFPNLDVRIAAADSFREICSNEAEYLDTCPEDDTLEDTEQNMCDFMIIQCDQAKKTFPKSEDRVETKGDKKTIDTKKTKDNDELDDTAAPFVDFTYNPEGKRDPFASFLPEPSK